MENVLAKAQGAIDFDVAASGSLVFVPSGATLDRTLTWVSRDGNEQATLALGGGQVFRPRLSPDGQRAVVQEGFDLWIFDP